MKKYMAPVTEIIDMEASAMICASKGGRMGDIGAGGTGSDYADPNWDNQGYGGSTDTDEDYGNLNSNAKSNSDIVDDED
jgi:hypothetical protein